MSFSDELFGDFEDLETGERHGAGDNDSMTGSEASEGEDGPSDKDEEEPYRGMG